MSRCLHIKNDDIEIEKVGGIVRVDVKDLGEYEQVEDAINFEYEDGKVCFDTALIISKIVEVL